MSDRKKITVVTHSSKFHTDDIFAIATLNILLGEENITLIRSRDMKIIEQGDYVVDVGQIYDESNNRFDHHQTEGAGKRANGVPYASFGLVWKRFGEQICDNKKVAEKIDQMLVQPIDSNDNGMQFLETKIEGLYPVDINLIINIFSPTWKENDINIDDVFMKLVSYSKVLLLRTISYMKDKVEAEQFVLDAYNKAKDKRLIELDERYPWEEVLQQFPEPLYVIYKKRVDDNWSLKCVPKDLLSYATRKRLPQIWAGKSDKELDKATGVPGGVFAHKNLFMCVNKTKEGILKMAEIALNS